MNREIIDELYKIVEAKYINVEADMAKYTSFKAGGNAAVLVEPQTDEELMQVLALLHAKECPHMVIGNGSNILVKDSGYDGVMIKIGSAYAYVEPEEAENENEMKLIAGSGAIMSMVAKNALANSLTGFEFASGIPGSIGGAVFMNAGAYGGEMVDILQKVTLISADGSRKFTLNADQLDMSYRHSILEETGDIVIEVEMILQKGDKAQIKETMADLAHKRNSKQPVQYPSAGSTFKRPEGYFAGKLIQDAGCKGLQVGGAQVSELHSGFIINKDNATATDILQLMEVVTAKVLNDFGVRLEPEVRIIG